MKAIRQYEFGDPSVLRYEEVPDPVPGPDQVLIQVSAVGVHLVDTTLRRGSAGGPPGREVAGVVDSPGAWHGKRVVAHLGAANGGYASLAVAPVAALHPVPDSMTAAAAWAVRSGEPSSTS